MYPLNFHDALLLYCVHLPRPLGSSNNEFRLAGLLHVCLGKGDVLVTKTVREGFLHVFQGDAIGIRNGKHDTQIGKGPTLLKGNGKDILSGFGAGVCVSCICVSLSQVVSGGGDFCVCDFLSHDLFIP